jgi:V/A-type H+-transporting ATPase subunit G/H
MELIKQIKEAENTAKRMIEDAQRNAVFSIENAGKQLNESKSKAEQDRRKKIEQAQAEGQKQGLAQAEQLKSQSVQAKQHLEKKAQVKIEKAVTTVLEFIKKPD